MTKKYSDMDIDLSFIYDINIDSYSNLPEPANMMSTFNVTLRGKSGEIVKKYNITAEELHYYYKEYGIPYHPSIDDLMQEIDQQEDMDYAF